MQLTKGAIGNLINRYKAVLKKCHLMNTFGSLAVAGMLVMGGAGMAVAADAQDVALKGENSYDSKTQSPVNHLMGGWLVNDAATAGDAKGDITLTVNGGTISEIIGGSYAKNLAANGDSLLTVKHGDITTTISDDTTSAEFVVGGSKVAGGAGANLETGKTSLTINGGTFGTEDKTNYELVMGGNYAKTAGNNKLTATTEGSSVTVKGGTFHASVVGGSVAHNYSINGSIAVTDNGNTSVNITGGTFAPSNSASDVVGGINLSAAVIGGGLAYGANTSTVLGSDTQDVTSSVTISGDAEVKGKVVAGSVVAEGGYAAVVHGNTMLTMQNGKVSDDLIGGGMVQDATSLSGEDAPSHNLIVTGNAGVTVDGGLEGVLGGVQGCGRVLEAAAAVLFGFPLGFHLLDVGAVLQHDVQQFAGGLGTVDGLAETFAHHEGQQTGMVDVRVGHEDEVDIARGVGTGIAVALLDGLVALVHAAVDTETLAAGLYHITGAGNGLGSAEKLDFHGMLRGDVLLAGCKRGILHYALPAPEAQGPINL